LASSLVATEEGGFVVAGRTSSKGAGDKDFWVVRTDGEGNVLWDKTYGTATEEQAWDIATVATGGYVVVGGARETGASPYHVWMVRIDEQGETMWTQSFGEPQWAWASAVVALEDGGFAFAGYIGELSGDFDMWLVRTTPGGDILWEKTFDISLDDRGESIAVLPDGFLIAGSTTSMSTLRDGWLVRTDEEGNQLWHQVYGSPQSETFKDVAVAPDGSIGLVGMTAQTGTWAHWAVKADAQGSLLWDKTSGDGAPFNWAEAVVPMDDGGFTVGGKTNATGEGNIDSWLLRLDSAGNPLWDLTVGGLGDDDTFDLVRLGDGGLAFAGMAGENGGDFWLVRTMPECQD